MKFSEPVSLLRTVACRCELPFGSPVSPDALSRFVSINNVSISNTQEAVRI
jgi:hypothetical protein